MLSQMSKIDTLKSIKDFRVREISSHFLCNYAIVLKLAESCCTSREYGHLAILRVVLDAIPDANLSVG